MVMRDDDAKVFNSSLLELAFISPEVKLMLSQPIQYSVGDATMLFNILSVDQDIVEVD